MSDQIEISGKVYISSKRASELSGYAQDYIGQLARGGLIDSQRVAGLWYVSMDSLTSYKKQASTFKPEPPRAEAGADPESLITFDGKDYVSAARAAKITGYHQDYVGQLARGGRILGRQVGNRWYVEREGILAHKQQKDSLLAAVQAESVGLAPRVPIGAIARPPVHVPPPDPLAYARYSGAGPFLKYTRDEGDLLPLMSVVKHVEPNGSGDAASDHAVPIRITLPPYAYDRQPQAVFERPHKLPSRMRYAAAGSAVALTIVIVLTFGFAILKTSSIYTVNVTETLGNLRNGTFTASAAEAETKIGQVLEQLLVSELVYQRVQ